MQIIDGKRVLFDVSDVEEFRKVWPCSGLPDKPLWFEFDWRGDLIDSNAPEDSDGGACNALADDARGAYPLAPRNTKCSLAGCVRYLGGALIRSPLALVA